MDGDPVGGEDLGHRLRDRDHDPGAEGEPLLGPEVGELPGEVVADEGGALPAVHPGAHRSIPYVNELPQYVDALPETDRLSARLIQLPSGALVTAAHVATICERIAAAQRHAGAIRLRTAEV